MKHAIAAIDSFFFHPDTDIFNIRRWGYFLAALILASSGGRLAYEFLDLPQYYAQPIVGSVTWTLSSKFHDYAALYVLVGGFLLSLVSLSAIAGRIAKAIGPAQEEQFHNLLIVLCVPAGVWFAGILATRGSALALLTLSTGLLLAALAFAVVLASRPVLFWQQDASSFTRLIQAGALGVVGVALAVMAISTGATRIAGLVHSRHFVDYATAYGSMKLALVAYLFAMLVYCAVGRSAMDLERTFRRLILAAQAFFPAFFLLLIPMPWLMGDRLMIGFGLTGAAITAIAILMIAAYLGLYKQSRNASGLGTDPLNIVSWIGLVAVLVFFKLPSGLVPGVDSDDYHFGEMLVPWWSWWNEGMVPFWDYAPARGLINYFPGAIDSFFLDGTASGFTAVGPYVYVFVLLFAFPALRNAVGLGIAALALLLAPQINGLSEIDLLVTAYLCFLCKGFFTWRASSWIYVWLASSVAILLYAPGQGALAMVALGPLALLMVRRSFIADRRKLAHVLLRVAIVVFAASVLTPLGKMVVGAVRYGAEQSTVNSIANGISWNFSFGMENANPWFFELIRASWLLVAMYAGVEILRARRSRTSFERSATLVYAFPIFLLTAFFVIRAAGRIDPGGSRLALTSSWCLSLLLPLLMFATKKARVEGTALLAWVSLAGLLTTYLGGTSTNYASLLDPVRNPTETPGFVVAGHADNARLGAGIIDPKQSARLTATRNVLDRVLEPTETYLDMTGRHAQYFYFDRRPPIESGAIYNLVTEGQQLRAVASIDKASPPLVLISSENIIHDGGPASLRAPLLYRHVLLQHGYKVVQIGWQVWLIRADRIDRIAGLDVRSVSDVDDSGLNVINDVFRQSNLRAVPASWGRSSSHLEHEMRLVHSIPNDAVVTTNSVVREPDGEFRITGPDPHVRFDVSAWNMKGRDAGVMSFDFACTIAAGPAPVIEVYWASESGSESEQSVVRFDGVEGHLIAPLDATPTWLMSPIIRTIRFDVQDHRSCTAFQIRNVRFFQRHGVDSAAENAALAQVGK